MNSLLHTLNPAIQEHLTMVHSLHPHLSLDDLASGWLEKERAFHNQSQALGMEQVEECLNPSCGFLALTYSGSLVAVGPLVGKVRHAVYISMDRRRTAPARSQSDQAVIDGSIRVGRSIVFTTGPVKQTSAVYKLAVLLTTLPPSGQLQALDEVSTHLENDFHAIDQDTDRFMK